MWAKYFSIGADLSRNSYALKPEPINYVVFLSFEGSVKRHNTGAAVDYRSESAPYPLEKFA